MFKSIKAKITTIISLTVLIGGLVASIVGTFTVTDTLKTQAYEKIRHDIQSAFALYQSEGEKLKIIIDLIAENIQLRQNPSILNSPDILDRFGRENSLDFLTIIDEEHRDIYTQKRLERFDYSRYNKSGNEYSETLSIEDIRAITRNEGRDISIEVIKTPYSYIETRERLNEAFCLTSASQFKLNEKTYFLYGGIILNKNFQFVDHIREIIFSKEFYKGKPVGTVTIFAGPIRITTNVLLRKNTRAIGTIIQDKVGKVVLDEGKEFIGRAFVVNTWYVGAYRPIPTRDRSKAILYVGLSESVYLSIQSNLILKFLFIAIASFMIIVFLIYFLISKITLPIENLSALSENVARGDFSKRADITGDDEIGRLARAFNQMIESIASSQKMLEEYNLTLQKKVQERTDELMKIKEQMMQSEKLASIGRLSAGVAHEINNPLGAILSYAHLIREELNSKKDVDQIVHFTDEIISETNRAKKIIKSLLEFSRQHKSEYEWVDINQVIEDVITFITIQNRLENIELIKNYGEDIPVVKIDTERIKEALINIIINALDAMNGKGRLTIKTEVDHKKNIVIISISDTGSGIPQEIMGHIFEPFFTTKPVGKGTGLGLSVTYGIIKQHNGDILVESTVGQGTTFTILLPLHP